MTDFGFDPDDPMPDPEGDDTFDDHEDDGPDDTEAIHEFGEAIKAAVALNDDVEVLEPGEVDPD